MQRGWVSLVLHRLWLGSLERTIISVNARFLCLSNTTAKTYSLERETRSMVKDWLDWLKTIQPKHHEWASIVCASHEVMSGSSQPMDPLQQARLFCPWNSPGKNTGVDCCALLQGIFLTQGLNSGLPHCRQIFYHLSHQGICTTVKKNNKDLDVINKKQ